MAEERRDVLDRRAIRRNVARVGRAEPSQHSDCAVNRAHTHAPAEERVEGPHVGAHGRAPLVHRSEHVERACHITRIAVPLDEHGEGRNGGVDARVSHEIEHAQCACHVGAPHVGVDHVGEAHCISNTALLRPTEALARFIELFLLRELRELDVEVIKRSLELFALLRLRAVALALFTLRQRRT